MLETVIDVSRILPALEAAKIVEHLGDLLAMAPTPSYQKPVMERLPRWNDGFIATRFGGDAGMCQSSTESRLLQPLEKRGTDARARRNLTRA